MARNGLGPFWDLKKAELYTRASKEQIWQTDATINDKSYSVLDNITKNSPNSAYDTLGNLVLETVKNKSVDYAYNELSQLVSKTTSKNEAFTYTYDVRGNCAGAERCQR